MSSLSILLVVLSSACSTLYTVHSSSGTIETDKFNCVAVNTCWYWYMFPYMVSEWVFLTNGTWYILYSITYSTTVQLNSYYMDLELRASHTIGQLSWRKSWESKWPKYLWIPWCMPVYATMRSSMKQVQVAVPGTTVWIHQYIICGYFIERQQTAWLSWRREWDTGCRRKPDSGIPADSDDPMTTISHFVHNFDKYP